MDNSDAQKDLPPQHLKVRTRRILWWSCGVAVLLALLWGAWQTTSDLPVGPSLVVLGVLGLVALWKGPQWQVALVTGLDPKDRFDRENEARKTLATILGGVVLLAGGFFTWRNIQVAQESLRVSQQGQITDRYTKAIEQLGAVDGHDGKKIVVRLGGIYALERIANESERDHWPIMEVLCTYVRTFAPVKKLPSGRKEEDSPHQPEPDIQAILTVLGRRDTKYEKNNQPLDLSSSDLRGADLSEADLSGANLRGADLSEADLSAEEDESVEEDLNREADLSGANLREANLSGADLTGADLSKASLGAANFSGADLTDVNLTDAIDLTQPQIDKAKGGGTLTLPKNLRKPQGWKE